MVRINKYSGVKSATFPSKIVVEYIKMRVKCSYLTNVQCCKCTVNGCFHLYRY